MTQSISLKTLMVPKSDYATVSDEGTLHDAVLALQEAQDREQQQDSHRYRDRAVLVVDKDARVLGKLSMRDVLRGLEPKYDRVSGSNSSSRAATRVGSAELFIRSMIADFGLWKKPLSNLVQKASAVKVKHLIGNFGEGETIDENAPIDSALHQFIVGQFQSLMVTLGQEIQWVLCMRCWNQRCNPSDVPQWGEH